MGWILVSCAMNLSASAAHLSKLQPDNLCATSSNFVKAIVLSEPMLHLLSTRYPPFPLFLLLPSIIHSWKSCLFSVNFVILSVMNLVPSSLPSMQLWSYSQISYCVLCCWRKWRLNWNWRKCVFNFLITILLTNLLQDPVRSFTGREKYKRPLWAKEALEQPAVVKFLFLSFSTPLFLVFFHGFEHQYDLTTKSQIFDS